MEVKVIKVYIIKLFYPRILAHRMQQTKKGDNFLCIKEL